MYKFKHSYTARDAAFMPLIIVATGIVYSFFFSLVITKLNYTPIFFLSQRF